MIANREAAKLVFYLVKFEKTYHFSAAFICWGFSNLMFLIFAC